MTTLDIPAASPSTASIGRRGAPPRRVPVPLLFLAFCLGIGTSILRAADLPVATSAATSAEPEMVLLDEIAIQNLRLEFAEATEETFEETVFALGRIEAIPARQAAVTSRIAGRVAALHVMPGDRISQGEEVAVIESRQPGDPPPTVSLVAPIGGLVTDAPVRLGDPVDPDLRIAEITDLSEVFAVARVPQHQASLLAPGTTSAHVRVAALPDESFEAELVRFGAGADSKSGTIDAIFRLPNPTGHLRAGMRAEFSIVVAIDEGVMSIPREALQGSPSHRHVYVRDFELENAFIKAPVVVGRRGDRSVEIVSGLLPGDTVVTRGAYSLAFAGGGNMTLKEALDAAHGHEHAADGSELPGNAAAAGGANGAGAGDHAHDRPGEAAHGHEHLVSGFAAPATWFFMATTAILLLLLIVQSLRGRTGRPEAAPESEPPSPGHAARDSHPAP